MNACLPTFQPIANTGCCQSYIFANLSVLGVIECRHIVVLICLILIYSEFFFFLISHILIACVLSLPTSGDCLWGWGGETEPVPSREGLGLGSGDGETVYSPAASQGYSVPASTRRRRSRGRWLRSPRAWVLAQGQGSAGAAGLGRSQTAPPVRLRSAPRSPGRCKRAP